MNTLQQLEALFAVKVDEHHVRDLEVPVLSGTQRQGDVIVIPTPGKTLKVSAKAFQVPAGGVPVVRGENGGNTHLLLASGEVLYLEVTASDTFDVGVFTVAEGAEAYLSHPEHGFMGIAPGTYTVRRQREQADEIRRVAD